jgi:hypothetical protein
MNAEHALLLGFELFHNVQINCLHRLSMKVDVHFAHGNNAGIQIKLLGDVGLTVVQHHGSFMALGYARIVSSVSSRRPLQTILNIFRLSVLGGTASVVLTLPEYTHPLAVFFVKPACSSSCSDCAKRWEIRYIVRHSKWQFGCSAPDASCSDIFV